MKLMLSAMAAGGLLGAADQYMCLLIISVLSLTRLVRLEEPMKGVMESPFFIGIVAFFWLLTTLPAYASALDPTIIKWINNITNGISGFVVPVSSVLLALASVGVIADMHPDLQTSIQAVQLFDLNGDGDIGDGLLMAGGSAAAALTLTGSKFLAKQAIGAGTGTAGSPLTGPIFATLENLASFILMALLYILLKIDPWLLVGLMGFVLLIMLGALVYALYKLWKLVKGIGRVIRLIETRPRIGWSIVAELFVWGLGSLLWKEWGRGIFRIVIWLLWLLTMIVFIPGIAALVGSVVVVVPVLEVLVFSFLVGAELLMFVTGSYIALRSAAGLMKILDKPEPAPAGAPVQRPAVP